MPLPRVGGRKGGHETSDCSSRSAADLCSLPAVAQKSELPPLVEPANAEHHVGKVIWADLVTPDLASSKRFYSGLFGWTFRDIHAGKTDYAVAFLDGRPVGGLHPPARAAR